MKEGWQVKRLGDISTISYGYTAKSSTEKGNYKYLRITDIQNNSVFWENVPFCNCSKEDATKYELIEGDIVFVRTGATTGKSFLLKGNFPKSLFASYLIRLQLINKDELLPDFLRYYFDTSEYWDIIDIGIVGAAQGGFNATKLSQLRIPTPPLSEQQRIVKILDTAFAKIDTVKQNAERNLQNTKELFQSVLESIFLFEKEKHTRVMINEVTEVLNGFAFSSKDFSPSNKIKSIKITNVGVKEFINDVENNLPENFKNDFKDISVHEGDIVLALTRTIISAGIKVAIVPREYEGALLNQRVAALVADERKISRSYLYYYLTSDIVVKYVMEHVNTLMQPNLSINDLKKMSIPLPPISEQQQIVSKLDALSAKCKELENNYLKTVNDCDELKKAILAKAFNGEL